MFFAVKSASDDFAAASRNSGKNLCRVLKIDIVCLRLFCEDVGTHWFLMVRKMTILSFKVIT